MTTRRTRKYSTRDKSKKCDTCKHVRKPFSCKIGNHKYKYNVCYCGTKRTCSIPTCTYCYKKSCASHDRMSACWSNLNTIPSDSSRKSWSSIGFLPPIEEDDMVDFDQGVPLSARHVYKHSTDKVWFDCDTCNQSFRMRPYHVMKGYWCPYCMNDMKRNLSTYMRSTFTLKHSVHIIGFNMYPSISVLCSVLCI